MPYRLNPLVTQALDPPTGETRAWVESGLANPELPLIDAAQAVPSYPPAPALMDHLSAFVRQPESAFYTPILGIPALRAALAADLARDYRTEIDADQVAITCGGNHAFCMAMLAVAGPGDEVILPEPFYFNHQMWFEMQGVRARPLVCREDDEGMVPDPDEAAALIGPRTRAIALISPNNPTGTIYGPERLSAFFDLAERHSLALMMDETYKDFLPGDGPPHPLMQRPGWQDVFVLIYSFSKVYSLTGYRVGAVVGGARFMEAVGKVADTMTICAPRVGQEAALFGLQHLADWKAGKRRDLLQRITLLDQAYAEHRPAFDMVSRGAFFAYLRHPYQGAPSLEVSRRLLAEQSLLTWPGSIFGNQQDAYIRLAFANAGAAEITEMVRRLAAMAKA